MITLHSIDLKYVGDPCYAEMQGGGCRALSAKNNNCRTWRCPFYKPKLCKEWVRIEDRQGVNLVPPEEYLKYRRTK